MENAVLVVGNVKKNIPPISTPGKWKMRGIEQKEMDKTTGFQTKFQESNKMSEVRQNVRSQIKFQESDKMSEVRQNIRSQTKCQNSDEII